MLFSELYGSLPKACERFHPLRKLVPVQARFDSLRDIVAYRDLVISYTKRDLTYADDILRAFAGVSGFLEKKMESGSMLYGLPSTNMSLAMAWVCQGLSTRRYTCTSMDGTARLSIPSWSWAGWTGRKYWQRPFGLIKVSLESGQYSVGIGAIQTVPWDSDLIGYCLPLGITAPCMLKFSATCISTTQLEFDEGRTAPLPTSNANSYEIYLPQQKIRSLYDCWTPLYGGSTYGVTMQQLLDPGAVMIRLGHWNYSLDHEDIYYTKHPKPFDNRAAHKGEDGSYGVFLVARWVNDEHTVCERIGLAGLSEDLCGRTGIEMVQKVVHLI